MVTPQLLASWLENHNPLACVTVICPSNKIKNPYTVKMEM